MSKMTFALAATLIVGTTMTSAANADALRVGFGFPLGSFVAHSNENYSGRDYRRVERPRYVRRDYEDAAPARRIVKVKQPSQPEVAEAPIKAKPVVQTAKLEDKLASDPATTTVIEKTPVAKNDTAPANETTGSIASPKSKTPVNAEKITVADTHAAEKSDAEPTTATTDAKHICRRYSPAIAALVDVPCE